jgi:hypothetical protein
LGYSRIYLNLGKFIVTGPGGPSPIQTFNAYESSDQYSVGIGLDYLVHVGIGFNTKRIVSGLSPIGTEQEQGNGEARVWASDFGLLVRAPLTDIASAMAGRRLEMLPRVEPLLDFSLGYVHGNEGKEVRYLSAEQADPLPRKAILGVGVEAGIAMMVRESRWDLLSVTLAREAEDLLIIRKADGTFTYQTGLGDISFADNVIMGTLNPKVFVRKGWQVQVGEILFVRGGRISGPGLAYSTEGIGLSINGVFRLLELVSPELSEEWVSYAAEHFDLQFCTSKYSDTTSPIDGTSFMQLNIVMKQLPF